MAALYRTSSLDSLAFLKREEPMLFSYVDSSLQELATDWMSLKAWGVELVNTLDFGRTDYSMQLIDVSIYFKCI